ncbi:MAG: prepilin-type N-terminal cleavage/methylation domain-containing protein [Candidatus Omnitrophota bacterium]
MSREKKGFTLVEVLIVVVILALLAGLVVPRLLSQPEKAIIAEAQHTLGIIRRGQITNYSLTNSYIAFTCTTAVCTEEATDLARLGLSAITGGSKFLYSCETTSNTCQAKRVGGDYGDATVTLEIEDGDFSCGPASPGAGKKAYQLFDSSDAKKGCTTAG